MVAVALSVLAPKNKLLRFINWGWNMIISEWKKQQERKERKERVNFIKQVFEFVGVGIVFWLGAITLIFGFWALGGCPL